MKRGRRKPSRRPDTTRINQMIRAKEVRLLDENNEPLGVMSLSDALKHAEERGTDLIEVTERSIPPVAKLMEYGKFQYEKKKKERDTRSKQKSTETKMLQVKIGTGEHDLNLKARRASEWLKEGHRVKLDLYLRGRSKYLDKNFLKGRLERLLHLLTVEYTVRTEPEKSPKGLTIILERGQKKKSTPDTIAEKKEKNENE